MDSNQPILDSGFATAQPLDPRDIIASGGKRFGNYLLDTLFFYIVFIGLVFFLMYSQYVDVFEDRITTQIIAVLTHFLYYFIFESALGKTPGKFITRTRVVNNDGVKPEIISIAGRNLARLVPFDAFSFLGTYARGWHDSWSNTWVIDEKKAELISNSYLKEVTSSSVPQT